MTKDRLAEYRRKANITDERGDEDNQMNHLTDEDPFFSNWTVVLEMQTLDSDLHNLFKQVQDLRQMLHHLTTDVDKVKQLQSTILSTPLPDERKKAELHELMSTIKTSSQIIRAQLREMDTSTANAEEEDSSSASARTRKTQRSALLRQFIDVMNTYQLAQTEYRDQCKARIKRQFEISGSKFSEDDVEDMIEQGNFSVFTRDIVISEGEQAKQTLADLEARHNDIKKLEKSLKELNELFLEMSILVDSQGEVVDRIEWHVNRTQGYVRRGQREVGQAQVWQGSAKKKKMWVIIILIVIALLLTLIIWPILP